MPSYSRVVLIVLDGVGAGAAPDAAAYGDGGSDTLGNTARMVGGLHLPNLARMGLGCIAEIAGVPCAGDATARHGRLRPVAAGKDSTTGHWELMGCALERPLPTYPHGFPREIIQSFERAIDRGTIGNRVASGTTIIQELGERHLETGEPIVYTSADSVFQIAAHEQRVPVDELYRWCVLARALLVPPHGVGRVIARPFIGAPGAFQRTARRRDFSVPPPRPTVLDRLVAAGKSVLTIGKIDDLFAGRGITRAIHTTGNREGMQRTVEAVRASGFDLVFVNLVDFDTMWGHRNDPRAFALGLEEFDAFLSDLLPALRDDDLLVITADHGNDPTTPSTDHSREIAPVLVWSRNTAGSSLGARAFADVGATVADVLGVEGTGAGRSLVARP